VERIDLNAFKRIEVNPLHPEKYPMKPTRLFSILLLVLGTSASVFSQVVETIGPKIAIFHATKDTQAAELPSFALVVSRHGPAGNGGVRIRPLFAQDGGKQIVAVPIAAGTALYGTGEVTGPLLRNGRTVTLWNSDVYGYDSTTPALYQSHPWVLGVKRDGTAFGIIFDSTYRQVISLPSLETGGNIKVTADGPAFAVVVIERDTPQQVVMVLADLTGHMPLPPKWALGYQQCRWSYAPDARAREIARNFRERHIPCDAIWFDIDYMDDFRIFSFDPVRFPEPKKLNDDLHAQGFHTVWMIDPGLKSNEQPPTQPPTPADPQPDPPAVAALRARDRADFAAMRDIGKRQNLFVKRSDGSDYEGEVWPGLCYFPDFTRADVRTWWASLYGPYLKSGVDGVWNDMNEPAVFNVPTKTMPEDNVHRADSELGGNGPHARYHNVFGMEMIRATRDGMMAARPDRRPFVLSRSGFLGSHRYGATWTGDNTANWEQLKWSVPMVLNLGLSGQPDVGPDIGGFAENGPDGAPPLDRGTHFARWMGVGAMLPFARGHTNKANGDKEPWAFGPGVEQTCRMALERRYRFMPYLYTVFREASVTGLPVDRPLFFADPRDPALRSEDDAFLLGDSLAVSCRMTPGRERTPALPHGWMKFQFPGEAANPDLPDLYLRPGAIVPAGPVMQYVNEKPLDHVTLLVCLDAKGEATGTLYEDAGDGYGYQRGDYRLTTFKAKRNGPKIEIATTTEGKWAAPANRTIEVMPVGTN
jgi:alpha-glucosidase